MKKMFYSASLRYSFLIWLLFTAAVFAQQGEPLDDFTQAVARYELTMPRIESYGLMMSNLAYWAGANPAKAAELKKREPKGQTSFSNSLIEIQKEPVLTDLMKKYQLTALDFMIIPMAVMQAQIAVMGEEQGRTFPAERINPKNTALVKANQVRVNEVMLKINQDRARAFGR